MINNPILLSRTKDEYSISYKIVLNELNYKQY